MQIDFSDKRVIAGLATAGIVVAVVIVLQVLILMGRPSPVAYVPRNNTNEWTDFQSAAHSCPAGTIWVAELNECLRPSGKPNSAVGHDDPRCLPDSQWVEKLGRCIRALDEPKMSAEDLRQLNALLEKRRRAGNPLVQ